MKLADIPFDPSRRTLRQFAAVWLLVFLGFGYRLYFNSGHHTGGIIFASIAVLVGIPGLLQPSVVRWVFVSATILTFPIGWLISQLMLAVLFYLVITPAALLFRLKGRDLLDRKSAPGRATFWTKKHIPQDVRSYFRQF